MKKLIKQVIVRLNLIKIFSLPFFLFRFFKIKNNKIVCMNFGNGKGYGDSPKYIVNELLKNNNEYDIVWSVKNIEDKNFPEGIRTVKIYSLKWFYEMGTAKIWISNTRQELFVQKRKKQYYIMTWHSALRLKKIEADAEEYLTEYYKKCAKHDSKMIDLMISGSDFSYNTYKNSFWYSGEILECGTPRCDVLFDELQIDEMKEQICEKYNIESNKKIILYAPTFRKANLNENKDINFDKIIDEMGSEYIFFLRYHPNTKIQFEDTKNVINVSKYPDMQELICIADILITDYSGCCFDMLIAKKPCILYVEDLGEYLKKERSLYFSFEELPFPKTKSLEELISCLKEFDYNDYNLRQEEFSKKIGLYEKGNASKTIVERIQKIVKEKSI